MLSTLRGQVTHLSQQTKRELTKNHNSSGSFSMPSVSYTYITELSIDGQAARLSSKTPQHIEEGDEVAVSGHSMFGTVQGLAYKNISKNITYGGGFMSALIMGAVLILVSLFASPLNLMEIGLDQFRDPFFWPVLRFARWGFGIFGAISFLDGLRHLLAFMQIKDL